MIEISQIKLPCGTDRQVLEERIRHILGLKPEERFSWTITRHSVDARRKPELYDVYSVRVALEDAVSGARTGSRETDILRRAERRRLTQVRQAEEVPYLFPQPEPDSPVLRNRPVVIGSGPAGLFCALMLARGGYRPIVLERGGSMRERVASVSRFWETGQLDPECNIQFGEGGAGTFSDGKINSNVRDRSGRTGEVVRTFLEAGAPGDIAWEQIPHIGTDRLRSVIVRIREDILSCGGEIRFHERADEFLLENGRIAGVHVCRGAGEDYDLPAEAVVLAPGHSARDTIRMMNRIGILMEAKPFAVGFRVSHPQSLINRARYGLSDQETMRRLGLTPASYKLTARAADGHGVYSFCMCPGGYVVNASSEPGRLAVNGMSDYLRDSARANSAIVMTVGIEEFGSEETLAGLRFQERLEEAAFRLSRGAVPVQRFHSFEMGVTDDEIPSPEELCIRGQAAPGALHTLLPQNLTADFMEGMHRFGRQIQGFDGPEAFVIGLESRTSSPVRILRSETGEASAPGLYPCGEGAGFAGGIMSAAVDGIRTAEHIAQRFRPPV